MTLFRSPHTGNLGESHCGGRSAVALRMAGYGAIVIKGVSDLPLYLAVHGDRVSPLAWIGVLLHLVGVLEGVWIRLSL